MAKASANKGTNVEMKEVFTLWKRESKSGDPYFTGKDQYGNGLVGFFNTNKKNPKEPDLKIYRKDGEGIQKDPAISMWCNVSKNDKKYLTGRICEQRYVGFITNDPDNVKRPYVRVYESETTKGKETPTEPVKNENKHDKVPF